MRYSILGVRRIKAELGEWIEQSEASLDTTESADHPSETRIDMLNDRLASLQAALDALEELEAE